ncbi:hypothetical protein CC2G_009639 [Coprinopsis cinerea AmutBmut pab1-1]|nr:hypothetical protein CC2G_009639 [Coprinopsis cinerea AmutBmut pab1-1]
MQLVAVGEWIDESLLTPDARSGLLHTRQGLVTRGSTPSFEEDGLLERKLAKPPVEAPMIGTGPIGQLNYKRIYKVGVHERTRERSRNACQEIDVSVSHSLFRKPGSPFEAPPLSHCYRTTY